MLARIDVVAGLAGAGVDIAAGLGVAGCGLGRGLRCQKDDRKTRQRRAEMG
jgi:hypothetical protein